ncbi:hypothetical protein AGOR_G00155480 [Albula goreensis]|uniref:Plakophilin-1 n=1 Tax=Albula goreensis TaxID=1534307 RepID=A0A8T3D4H3_9TELE|nr:hypothetical protein AGOR_G00155480 [Albula goreensis]
MTLEPLRSAMSMKQVEETSLALPSDNKLRSGQQRVLDQVHTIKRSKSKYSKSGSGSLSPTSPKTPGAYSEFRFLKYSPSMPNGSVFSKGNANGAATYMKTVSSQQSFPPTTHSMKGTSGRRNMSTSSQWEKQSYNFNSNAGRVPGNRIGTRINGLSSSRSEPELAPINTMAHRSVSTLRSQPNRASIYSSSSGNGQYISSNPGQFGGPNSGQFLTNSSSHYLKSNTPVGTINSPMVKGSGTGSSHMINNQSSFVVDSPSLTESNIFASKTKGNFSGVNMNGSNADMTMKDAVEYLFSQDENYQHCGASFIQHSTYKEDKAKREVLQLKGIPQLVALLRSPSPMVRQTASAALRNLVFKDDENKQEVQRCGGITEALALLKDTDSSETQKQLTGLLWNLSSSDSLKPDLVRNAVPVLTESVLVPFTGSGEQSASSNMDPDVFYYATGCLRNLSCAKKGNRQALRNTRGLIDSLVSYVQACVAANRPDDKSVENCVCILHNLTYQLETEAPNYFTKINALAGSPSRASAQNISDASSMGCFSTQSSKIPQETTFDYPVMEDSNPKGMGWLFHSKTMDSYLSLMRDSQNDATLEACAGALQNLTAHKGSVSNVMSQAIVQKLNGMQSISPLLQSSNSSVQKTATSLLGNLSRAPRLQSSIARQTLPQIASLISSGTQNGPESDETMASACQAAGSLLMAEPEIGKKLLNNSFINSLNDLSRNSYFPKSSKAAALLLYGLWSEKNFQGFFKKQGMNKASFVNDITTSIHKSLQVFD